MWFLKVQNTESAGIHQQLKPKYLGDAIILTRNNNKKKHKLTKINMKGTATLKSPIAHHSNT